MEQIAQKICVYQKIVVPLNRFSYLNWIYGDLDTLRSDCVGCFVVYLAQKIVHFTKNTLFFSKKSGKNLHMSKKCSTFAPSNK